MAVTKTAFKVPGLLTNAAATIFTTPTGLSIIRFLNVSNPTSAPVGFTMSLGADSSTTRIYDGFLVPAFTVLPIFCTHIVATAVTVQAFASVTSGINLEVTGDVITLG